MPLCFCYLRSYNQFVELNTKFPSLLFPAFTIQSAIRRRVLGDAFWENEYARRAAVGAAASYSIFDVLHAMEEARLKAGSREVAAALKGRYVPAHLRDKPGYIPSISEDPVGKAKARRRSLGLADAADDLGGLGGGGHDATHAVMTRKGSTSALAAAAAAASSSVPASLARGGGFVEDGSGFGDDDAGGGGGGGRRGSIALDAVVQRMRAGDVRRVSVIGDSGTRRAAPSGGVGATTTQRVPASSSSQFLPQLGRGRGRKSGLANAQERAARMAMSND